MMAIVWLLNSQFLSGAKLTCRWVANESKGTTGWAIKDKCFDPCWKTSHCFCVACAMRTSWGCVNCVISSGAWVRKELLAELTMRGNNKSNKITYLFFVLILGRGDSLCPRPEYGSYDSWHPLRFMVWPLTVGHCTTIYHVIRYVPT